MNTKVRVGEKKQIVEAFVLGNIHFATPCLWTRQSRRLQLDRCRMHEFNLTSTFLAGLRRRGPSPDRGLIKLGQQGKLLRLLALLWSSTFTQKRVDFFLFLVKISRVMIIVVTNAVKQVNDEVDEMWDNGRHASSHALNCASRFGLVEICDVEIAYCATISSTRDSSPRIELFRA